MTISNLLDDIVFGIKHTSCWGGYEAECAGRYAIHESNKAFVFGASYWVHGEVRESVYEAHAKFLSCVSVCAEDHESQVSSHLTSNSAAASPVGHWLKSSCLATKQSRYTVQTVDKCHRVVH